MGGGDLDGDREGVDARAPVDDAVAPRVDGGERDAGRQRQPALLEALARAVAGDAVLGHQARPAGPAEPHQHLHAPGQARVMGTRCQHRAAQRDDPGDQVGAAYGEPTREHPAQAVPDHLYPAAAAQGDRLQSALQLRGRVEGAAGVEVDRGPVGAVAVLAQHPRHRAERAVTGQEARHQDHGRGVAHRAQPGVRRTAAQPAALDGSQGEPAGLGDRARLAEHR